MNGSSPPRRRRVLLRGSDGDSDSWCLLAHAFELRTAVSLGELRLRQGRHAEARSIVESVIVRYTEGSESWDMRRATELLRRLG